MAEREEQEQEQEQGDEREGLLGSIGSGSAESEGAAQPSSAAIELGGRTAWAQL